MILARHATHYLQFKPDTDVALLNAMMKSIIDQNLIDEKFINERTTDFDELKEHLMILLQRKCHQFVELKLNL